MFATGMTCSHEQLIMDEEISAMSKRIARGIQVDDETIALSLVKQIGPGSAGDLYLAADHTLKWLRSEEYILPRVSVRGSYQVWENAGKKNTYQLARDKVKELGGLKRIGIDPERKAKLEEIVKNFTV
jgi:trimethylamine--corrinoid protein Co-methyltransferase